MNKINRAEFLRRLSMVTGGAVAMASGLPALKAFAAQPQNRKKVIGLQLYSVRQLMGEGQPPATLKALADCGYLALEGFGYNNGKYFGYEIADFGKMTKDLGMQITSSHLGTRYTPEEVQVSLDWWKDTADRHAAIGCKTMVMPSLPTPRGMKMDANVLGGMCDYINKANEIAKSRGMRMGFHNHAVDERPLENGKIVLDQLLADTDPTFFVQLDNHNMMTSGRDPIAFLNQYKDRTKVLHIKDDSIIGASGKVNFEELFTTAAKYGIYEPIVEVENYTKEPLECMKESCAFLLNAPYVKYFG